MHEYTEELQRLNPLTTQATFQKTQETIEELSASALENSRKIEMKIETGEIALQLDDEGHFARLKSVLNEITTRHARRTVNEELRTRIHQRTKEMHDFMDNLMMDHNALFLLVEKLAKSEKKFGLSLIQLGDLLENSEQGKVYSSILDSILNKFITSFKLQAQTNLNERPNVYTEHIEELNMLHQILVECNQTKAKRMHLCLGCWKLVSFGSHTMKKARNLGFKGRNYPLLIPLKEMVEIYHENAFDEPEISLKNVIFFLWYSNHKFISEEANDLFTNPRNSPYVTFMPFPALTIEEKKRTTAIPGNFM